MKAIIENVNIQAITSWLPKNVLEMSSLVSLFGERDVFNIIKATGVERARIADETMTSSDMCFNAALYLIEKEHLDLSKIDGLVFVSQTADYILPSTSNILQARLALNKSTICLDIRHGCSGYIYGIFQAALWINAGACNKVIVLAGDTSSKMINEKDRSLRMVFGDSGTATLVTKGNNNMGFSLNSDGLGYDKLIIPAGGFRLKRTTTTNNVKKDVNNNWRSLEDMYMDGAAIFDFAISNVSDDIDELIEYMDWRKGDIQLFALHQANKFMVNSIRKKMKVDIEKVPINSNNYGNTGPASIPLLLSDLLVENNFDLRKVILSGFGVGLSWGSVACNLTETKFYKPINK